MPFEADIFPPASLPGASSNQWRREVERRVTNTERSIYQAAQNQAGDNRSIASQIEALSATVRAIPIQASASGQNSGFALTGAYTTIADAIVTVPEGKNFASILAIGTGAALDATTGGLTNAYGRIVVVNPLGSNFVSIEFPAAKDAGASQVNNIISASMSQSLEVVPLGDLRVVFQMYGLNGSAYPARPSNVAQIAFTTTFTTV